MNTEQCKRAGHCRRPARLEVARPPLIPFPFTKPSYPATSSQPSVCRNHATTSQKSSHSPRLGTRTWRPPSPHVPVSLTAIALTCLMYASFVSDKDTACLRRHINTFQILGCLFTFPLPTKTVVNMPLKSPPSNLQLKEALAESFFSDPPPSYASHAPSYHVGTSKSPTPLVLIEHLKAHLSLLGAFKNLRVRLAETPGEALPRWVGGSGIAYRWEMLVSLAVERYVKGSLSEWQSFDASLYA